MYSNQIICNVLEYIDSNINRKITIEELENRFFYNRYYIMKLFKKEIGVTIFEYINMCRIHNSMRELKKFNNSLTTIYINNGFYSLEYFSEIFKKVTGVNPTTFRKFWYLHSNIKESDLIKIRETLVKLTIFMEKKNKYLKNIKPVIPPVKKLSIFNQ